MSEKQNKMLFEAFKFWRATAVFMLAVSIITTVCGGLAVNNAQQAAEQSAAEYQEKLESVEHVHDLAVEQLGGMAQKVEALEAKLDAIRNLQENLISTHSETPKMNIIDECTITYYCAEKYPHICGLGLGVTATGIECDPGHIVAVDPNVIPLHSKVIVDYGNGDLHSYYAEDVGGSIKGNHIDVMCETHNEALNAGKTTATVYWIKQEEQK